MISNGKYILNEVEIVDPYGKTEWLLFRDFTTILKTIELSKIYQVVRNLNHMFKLLILATILK